MAKQISQDTFDAVVKENIDEFDMSPEEAIEDAVSQFTAQDVNLANIVKDLVLHDSDQGIPAKHPVLEAVEALSKTLANVPCDEDIIKLNLATIEKECNIDLAHRCLAGKNNAYAVLYQTLDMFQDSSHLLLHVLAAFCSLCNGQPDVLDMRGLLLLKNVLKKQQHNADTAAALVKLIRLTCVMHEKNRQAYVHAEIIPLLMSTLENHQNAVIVKEVCFALRVLTNDDDPRVPFGKAHDHAKMIVTEADALRKILSLCKDYGDDTVVLGELFLTLGRLAVRNEFCQEIMDRGGLGFILDALQKNLNHKGIAYQALVVLKAIAGNDQVKVGIVKALGVQLIIACLNQHLKHPGICEMGCATLAALALRNPDHSQIVIDNNGPEVIVKVMQIHTDKAAVEKQACMVVRNVVARNEKFCEPFLLQGVEHFIQLILANHSTCHDEAKAALRDLGCKVELIERWKGEGHGIHA